MLKASIIDFLVETSSGAFSSAVIALASVTSVVIPAPPSSTIDSIPSSLANLLDL